MLAVISFCQLSITVCVVTWESSQAVNFHPGIRHKKNTLGCMAGLTFTLVCVAAAGLLVVIQWEASARGDQRLTNGLIRSRIRRVSKGSVDFCPRVLHVSFSCFPGFSLVLNPRKKGNGTGKCIYIALIFVLHERHSGMDHTVLPAITPIPVFTS